MGIRPLKELSKSDAAIAGGKGANLGEMLKLGLPVPPGFCLTVDTYVEHMRAIGLAEKLTPLLDQQDWAAVEQTAFDLITNSRLSDETVKELLTAYHEMGSPEVAVRSSATMEDSAEASFAGQQETLLNVSGDDALLTAVRKCWASLWGARALAYRQQHKVDHLKIAMAVVVQQMVEAEAAGVMFTIDPVAQRADRLLIQAVRGLGESVVSGRTKGDIYRVERSDSHKIIERDAESQGAPILNEQEVSRLCEFGLKLEKHFGCAQDVEFAIARDEIFLVQTRPITGMSSAQPESLPAVEKTNFLQRKISGFSDDRYPIAPKPLDQLFFSVQLEATAHALRCLGYSVSAKNEAAVKDVVWRQTYLVPKLYPTWRLVRVPFLMIRTLNRDWNHYWQEPKKRLLEVSKPVDPEALTDEQLLVRADHIMQVWHETMNLRFSFLFGVLADVALRLIVTLAVGRTKTPGMIGDLMSGLKTRALEVNEALWKLAQHARSDPAVLQSLRSATVEELSSTEAGRSLLKEVAEFLDEFGQREGVTWYLSTPTWRQDAGQVWRLLRALAEVPTPPASAGAERSEAAVRLVSSRLRFFPGLPRLFRWLVDRLRRLQKFREDSHFDSARPLDALQELAREWGRRLTARDLLKQPNDIYYLSYPEVRAWLTGQAPSPEAAQKHIARRQATYQVVNARWQAEKFRAVSSSNGSLLKGVAASPGVVRAKARIIRGENQFDRLQPGEILVCPYTSPAWTSLFASASGVITEIGGAGAHAAIVAREYGIPAVMGIAGATNRIVDGQELLIDGAAGHVYLGDSHKEVQKAQETPV